MTAPGLPAGSVEEQPEPVGFDILHVPTLRLKPCTACGHVMETTEKAAVEAARSGRELQADCASCGKRRVARRNLIIVPGRAS